MGCGFGRLGMMIQRIRPEASYTGVDICQEMLESAKRHLPRGTFRKMSIQRYRPTELRKRDLVISAEVLMHQPENYHSFSLLLRRMVWLSNRWILNCDWDPQDGDPGNNWNIPHDYRALYGRNLVSATPAGIPDQTIFLAEVT
jgi:hypothetical protein